MRVLISLAKLLAYIISAPFIMVYDIGDSFVVTARDIFGGSEELCWPWEGWGEE